MSDREEWMTLIRNEYDPAPSHYRMGDDWDDGAGRIADAILADNVLTEKNAARAALTTLASAMKVFAPDLTAELAKRWTAAMRDHDERLEAFLKMLREYA